MSKLEKCHWGQNGAHLSDFFRLVAPSVEQFELFFSKMVKLEEKESPDPKLSDFEWFGEVFKITMFNMFGSITLCSFLILILVWFCCNTTHFKAYDLLYKNMKKNFATRGAYKTPKMCENGSFWHEYLIGPLVTKFFHIFVEEVISFKMSGVTTKSDKNCLQK